MISKAQIKYIHSLRNKKYRQKFSQFTAEGTKVVTELLNEGIVKVSAVYAVRSWLEGEQGSVQRLFPCPVTEITEDELAQLSSLSTPHEVLAVCHMPEYPERITLNGAVTLALEAVRDPGNLGTIIRIADWFGIGQVICSPDCADAYNPKTVQATMGSIAHVKVMEGELLPLLQQAPVPVYAATLQGREWAALQKISEGVLLIGNESQGLSPALRQTATCEVTIPRLGKAESLNAAVAAGILCSKLLLG
jgi:TrmH family RNA methyltransferase